LILNKGIVVVRILTLVIAVLLFSCTDDNTKVAKDKVENCDTWYSKERAKYRSKAYKAINDGNEDLYAEVSDWFLLSKSPSDLAYFSNIMAYKHNSGKAFYDNFSLYSFYSNFEESDSTFISFLLYNLAKAKELGYEIRNESIHGIKMNTETIKNSTYYFNNMSIHSRSAAPGLPKN
jgi:hypothetical protein